MREIATLNKDRRVILPMVEIDGQVNTEQFKIADVHS